MRIEGRMSGGNSEEMSLIDEMVKALKENNSHMSDEQCWEYLEDEIFAYLLKTLVIGGEPHLVRLSDRCKIMVTRESKTTLSLMKMAMYGPQIYTKKKGE